MNTHESIPHPSPSDRAMLQFYEAHENNPPRWLELSKRVLPKWLRMTLLGVAAFGFVEYVGADGFARGVLVFCAGYLFGVIVKDAVEIHKLLTTWPVLIFILDWSRIRSLLGESDVQRDQ